MPTRSKLRLRSTEASQPVSVPFKKALSDDLVGDVACSLGQEFSTQEFESLRKRVVTKIQVDSQFTSMLAEQISQLKIANRMALYVTSADLVLQWSAAVVASHGVLDQCQLERLADELARGVDTISATELAGRFAKLQLENTELFEYVSRLMLRIVSEKLG